MLRGKSIVDRTAHEMQSRLVENSHKVHWYEEDWESLLETLQEEYYEFTKAVRKLDRRKTWKELGDLAVAAAQLCDHIEYQHELNKQQEYLDFHDYDPFSVPSDCREQVEKLLKESLLKERESKEQEGDCC